MYPNLYYVFKDWFGVEWKSLSFLNTFGLMVAMGFVGAAIVLSKELQRREKMGLLSPRQEMIVVGKPASISELLINALVGFVFGYKLIGLFFSKPDDINPQDYIFSGDGSVVGGLLVAAFLTGLKWWDKNKQKLKEPENRNVRIWPHDRVGDIIILGLVFGILGAKLFDNLENWDDFIKNPGPFIFSKWVNILWRFDRGSNCNLLVRSEKGNKGHSSCRFCSSGAHDRLRHRANWLPGSWRWRLGRI